MANAIMQGSKLEDMMAAQDQHSPTTIVQQRISQQEPSLLTGQRILCDAAWANDENMQSCHAGIGIVMQLEDNEHCQQLCIAAISPPVSSPLEAEAYGLLLATTLADTLRIQDPQYYTDCSVLAAAAAAKSIFKDTCHWNIRPVLASIQASPSFGRNRVAHVNRCFNVKAHHQAKLATKIQNRPVAFRRLFSDTGHCIVRDVLATSSVSPFTLLSVKCC